MFIIEIIGHGSVAEKWRDRISVENCWIIDIVQRVQILTISGWTTDSIDIWNAKN